jgi:superoxide oxidase
MTDTTADVQIGSAIIVKAAPRVSRRPFDFLTIVLHWTTALMVLTMIGSGILHGQVEGQPWAAPLLRFHRSLGVTVWAVTMLRLLWRNTGAKFPKFPVSMTSFHRMAVRVSEYALYALLLIQPATGLAQSLILGRPVQLLIGSIPALLPKDLALAEIFHEVHELGAWCMIGLVGLHAAGALLHYFVWRDDVMESMAPILRRRGRHGYAAAGRKNGP